MHNPDNPRTNNRQYTALFGQYHNEQNCWSGKLKDQEFSSLALTLPIKNGSRVRRHKLLV